MPTDSSSITTIGFIALLLASAMATAYSEINSFEEAVRRNDLEGISSYLKTASTIDVPGTNGKTALMIAAKAGKVDLVDRLLDQHADPNAQNINGGTPLMFAAISGSVPVITRLLDAGADVNMSGSNGWNALMVAAAKGHAEATQLLLDAGAAVNAPDIYLWTPLHRAAYENRASVVKILLRHENIRLMQQDDHGATALHHAAAGGYREIVDMLISAGAEPARADLSERTPAAYARQNGHLRLASLLARGH